MKERIRKQLQEIEADEHIKILIAVESGSRAWGFASPDSDYDVRFIYIRQVQDYLRLDLVRDVIELSIDDVFDINGWDLQKALRLLHNSNPKLFEWFSSPIVYLETDFANRFRNLMNRYFSKKKTLYHYINMAEGNYRKYLKSDMVKAKKYFYVLRPVLACRWILDRGTPPPMLFSELMEAGLPEELTDEVNRLLKLKMNSPEVKLIPQISPINDYLDKSIMEIKSIVKSMENSPMPDWEELNEIFLHELSCELYDQFVNINHIDQAIYESEQEIENGAKAVDAFVVFEELEKKH